ncbi:MAG TPA: hypothetical protein VFQ91_18820 [Bryobacteraceae bacterium]|nr:hypothetical protein [Bryobacteraceae bacterium]
MEIQTFRTSTILIATDGKPKIYRSRSEIAPDQQENLQKALNSPMAATILIADQRGRDEILKLLRGEPSALRDSSAPMRRRLKTEPAPVIRATLPGWLRSRWTRALIAFLLPAAVGAGFYALLTATR